MADPVLYFQCDVCRGIYPIGDRIVFEAVLCSDFSKEATAKFVYRMLNVCAKCVPRKEVQ